MPSSEYATKAARNHPVSPGPQMTSISARAVVTIQVSMSSTEMDMLCQMLDQVNRSGVWTGPEQAIASEFVAAIESFR